MEEKGPVFSFIVCRLVDPDVVRPSVCVSVSDQVTKWPSDQVTDLPSDQVTEGFADDWPYGIFIEDKRVEMTNFFVWGCFLFLNDNKHLAWGWCNEIFRSRTISNTLVYWLRSAAASHFARRKKSAAAAAITLTTQGEMCTTKTKKLGVYVLE